MAGPPIREIKSAADWEAATRHWPLLDYLDGKTSLRKFRLFGVACCRTLWVQLCDVEREAVELVEAWAEGRASPGHVERLSGKLPGMMKPMDHVSQEEWAVVWLTTTDASEARIARNVADFTAGWHGLVGAVRPFDSLGPPMNFARPIAILRDIFGNPFRPVSVDVAWLAPNVVAIARHIYDERAFERLPILADALEDVGCVNTDVLDHCRQPSEHTRGCWLVDLVLEKQ